MTMYCMMYMTLDWYSSATTIMLFMSLLPGNLHFARTNAAIDANMLCNTVTDTVTATLLNT